MKIKTKLDKIIMNSILIYLLIPILIFIIFFLKWYLAITFSTIFIFAFYKISKSFDYTEETLLTKKNIIMLSLIILLWVFFSGIGGYSYQNDDYRIRNIIFNDLINYDWPVIYNFENSSSECLKIIETYADIGFSYYFLFWLPSSLIGKIFGIQIARFFLYIWSAFGILQVVYLVKRYSKVNPFFILLGMICFSGMDIVGCLFTKYEVFLGKHIEWWTNYMFQYSSFTTDLYWVFNQAIPVWIVTMLLLNVKDNKSALAIGSIAFIYSPFSIFGMIPVMILASLKQYNENNSDIEKESIFDKFKNAITFQNLLIPSCIILIFGSYYLLGGSKITRHEFIFGNIKRGVEFLYILKIYLIFILCEFGLYTILIYKNRRKNSYFILAAISLIFIPFYKLTAANDFAMRTSIPALFIIFVNILMFYKNSNEKIKKVILSILLIIGMVTPFNEIYRSIDNTYHHKNIISIDETMKNTDEMPIETFYLYCEQFVIKNYEDTFFYRFLSK